jgi:hypothetical protein
MRLKDTRENTEEAEIIALNVLSFLLSDSERTQRFVDLSGLGPEAIRAGAGDKTFLGSILDYLLADQTLLLIFTGERGLNPERIAVLRRKLPGASLDF